MAYFVKYSTNCKIKLTRKMNKQFCMKKKTKNYFFLRLELFYVLQKPDLLLVTLYNASTHLLFSLKFKIFNLYSFAALLYAEVNRNHILK